MKQHDLDQMNSDVRHDRCDSIIAGTSPDPFGEFRVLGAAVQIFLKGRPVTCPEA